ncbi:hypothetical protein [Acidaminococcus sp. CAG:542]|uniref:hypothetical protein n=1 Tax=Acidaminococcus sp. CAG:542 TaxID=1262687 RepID=UPI0025852AD3|nr:hypothetical protein [Acidaminococcus sp. CAG:542]
MEVDQKHGKQKENRDEKPGHPVPVGVFFQEINFQKENQAGHGLWSLKQISHGHENKPEHQEQAHSSRNLSDFQFDQPGINKKKDSRNNPVVRNHGFKTAQFVQFPQPKVKEPLLHDKMKVLMDGERLHMGNAKLFHIPAAVQQEPAIVVEPIGKNEYDQYHG